MTQIRIISQEPNTLLLSACLNPNRLAVGTAKFEVGADGMWRCELLHVEPHARRQGLASAMYDFAETHLAMKCVASNQLTEDSVAFLTARGIAIPIDAVIKDYDEWFAVSSPGISEDEEGEPRAESSAPKRPRM